MKTSNELYVGGTRLRLDPRQAIGKGGEADVYDVGKGLALKVFKPPDHPDFALDPEAQRAARLRLDEQQTKLPAFPAGLPPNVIAPEQPAYDAPRGGRLVGYAMRRLGSAEVLLRYADRQFRESGGIDGNQMAGILREIHATIPQIHRQAVIGDFNDLNILVENGKTPFFIDADSFQYGGFMCRVFTARFVDPLLCDPSAGAPLLARPHTRDSDWYAFAVMLMQCFLYVDPYGGLYRPRDANKRIGHNARPLHRITVFHPEVRYPKPALSFGILPDELLQHLHLVFEKDTRGAFPRDLLDSIRWTRCSACGQEHARPTCPNCVHAAPAAVRQTTVVRGTVTSTRFFTTTGTILTATVQHGELRYVYHENGEFKREDGSTIIPGGLDAQLRFKVKGKMTLVGRQGQVVLLEPGKPPERMVTDGYERYPVFDTNADRTYWVQSGQLYAEGDYGPRYLGNVLANQTRFWVGPTFGFGFYRAGSLSVGFVFDAARPGINDTVKLPPITGQIIEAHAVFSKDRCWWFVSAQEQGDAVHRCLVLGPDGSVVGSASAGPGDGNWLSDGGRGACAVGAFLLVPTDGGLARIEVDNGALGLSRTFPDTEPFVHTGSLVLPGQEGIYVVGQQDIQLIKIR